MPMVRVEDVEHELAWLQSAPWFDLFTGIDPDGWPADIWVLNSTYINDSLPSELTHDKALKHAVTTGLVEPEVIGDVNLDLELTATGGGLGYVVRPAPAWHRTTWRALGAVMEDQRYPPCFRWFPARSHPVSVLPPTEGSLDEESLVSVLAVLALHSALGPDSECCAFYGVGASGDLEGEPHLWRGRLREIPMLLDINGGAYRYTPSNIWPVDKSWMLATNYDLSGTRISGSEALIADLDSSTDLETIHWSPPRNSSG